jgi:hypothetical protein
MSFSSEILCLCGKVKSRAHVVDHAKLIFLLRGLRGSVVRSYKESPPPPGRGDESLAG